MYFPVSALICSLIFALLCSIVAQQKNRDTVLWAILGFLFGLFAMIFIVIAETKEYSAPIENGDDFSLGDDFDSQFTNDKNQDNTFAQPVIHAESIESEKHPIFKNITSSESYESYVTPDEKDRLNTYGKNFDKPRFNITLKQVLFVAGVLLVLAVSLAWLLLVPYSSSISRLFG